MENLISITWKRPSAKATRLKIDHLCFSVNLTPKNARHSVRTQSETLIEKHSILRATLAPTLLLLSVLQASHPYAPL